MDKIKVIELTGNFEKIRQQNEEGVEYWLARDLQKILGYSKWDNFISVIEKAKTACENSGYKIGEHFVDTAKTITKGYGAAENINDMMLTRYACYIIAQNGNPGKEEIAFAQTYFASQTRKQEIIEKQLADQERLAARRKLIQSENELSSEIYQRGVDNRGFARIRSKGDAALFGVENTEDMKERLGVPNGRPIADFLSTVAVKAKDLATEMTNINVIKNDIRGENSIKREHVDNNKGVRGTLVDRGIYPEDLPAEEDIKKIERKMNSTSKKLGKEKPLKKLD